MEADMLHAAGQALLIILDPMRMAYLFAGVCMGLALGILPGIGGVAGLALLLPFTFNMDAAAAFALLLGMGSTTGTTDPISAILFGAPGHAASAATVLDGYPMTKRGEAGRVAHDPGLHVDLEPQGVGEAAGGKEPIGELEQGEKRLSGHGDGRPPAE